MTATESNIGTFPRLSDPAATAVLTKLRVCLLAAMFRRKKKCHPAGERNGISYLRCLLQTAACSCTPPKTQTPARSQRGKVLAFIAPSPVIACGCSQEPARLSSGAGDKRHDIALQNQPKPPTVTAPPLPSLLFRGPTPPIQPWERDLCFQTLQERLMAAPAERTDEKSLCFGYSSLPL